MKRVVMRKKTKKGEQIWTLTHFPIQNPVNGIEGQQSREEEMERSKLDANSLDLPPTEFNPFF